MMAGALYEFVPCPYQSLLREDNGLGISLIPEDSQVALAYQQLLSDALQVEGGQEKGPPPSAYPDSSLEGKLKRLTQTHNDGFITGDESASKKKALLDVF